MEIKTFGVVGAGQMGAGIAQVAAMSGVNVVMHDISEQLVQKGFKNITQNLEKSVDKGKLNPAEKDAALARIKATARLQDMEAADYVVEAASERQDIKFAIFRDLD